MQFESIFSVDCVIFGFDEGELKILLIERNEDPFKDWFALPGNLVDNNESIEAAAERILYELTGLKGIYMEQYHTFGESILLFMAKDKREWKRNFSSVCIASS